MGYKYTVRNSSGETREVSEDKVHLAEKDGFRPVVSNEYGEERTTSFSNLGRAAKDGFTPSRESDVGFLESGARGLAQGLTFGLVDEATGAIESAFTDKTYEQARDESRANYNEAKEANPLTYGASELGGAIGSAFIPGMGALNAGRGARLAEVAGKAALQGGLSGYGNSTAEDTEGLLKDTAKGAVIGGGLGAAGYGVAKGAKYLADNSDDMKDVAETVYKGFKKGYASEGAPGTDILDTAISIGTAGHVPTPFRAIRGVKGAVEAIKQSGATKKEIAAVANELRSEIAENPDRFKNVFGFGTATDLSDDEVLVRGLLDEGDNSAKRYITNKVAAEGHDAEQFKRIVTRSAEDTKAARSFDRVKEAEDLTDGLTDTYKAYQKEAGSKFEALKNEARDVFPQQDTAPVRILSDAMEAATKRKSISGNTRNVLNDIFDDVAGRADEKNWTQLTAQEQFDRIHGARQRLGKAVKWAATNELPEGQQILQNTYDKFGTILKSLDAMAEADKGFSQFKRIEKGLFKKLGNVEQGAIKDFDSTKIETLLGGTKSSRKLAKELSRFKTMAESGQLSPEAVEKMKPFMDKLDEALNKSELNRDLTKFRYEAGPTSPAVQQLQKKLTGAGMIQTASESPQLFLKLRENAASNAMSMYQKPFKELNLGQQKAVTKFALWQEANVGASENEVKRQWTLHKSMADKQ